MKPLNFGYHVAGTSQMDTFGRRMREARQYAGLSETDAAAGGGYNPQIFAPHRACTNADGCNRNPSANLRKTVWGPRGVALCRRPRGTACAPLLVCARG